MRSSIITREKITSLSTVSVCTLTTNNTDDKYQCSHTQRKAASTQPPPVQPHSTELRQPSPRLHSRTPSMNRLVLCSRRSFRARPSRSRSRRWLYRDNLNYGEAAVAGEWARKHCCIGVCADAIDSSEHSNRRS